MSLFEHCSTIGIQLTLIFRIQREWFIFLFFFKIWLPSRVCIFPFSPSENSSIFHFSASTLSAFFFHSPEQRGQLLIPDKRLAFGGERREPWGRGERGERRGEERRGGGRMGAAHRSRQREGNESVGIKEQRFWLWSPSERRGSVCVCVCVWGGGGDKMRSDRDLNSKTPRHNRQGFTPREPPHPQPSTSVKTITERRGAA